ncbi:MAG: hypothetical protein IPM37_15110 [Hahellaceae bacterium]|nr:hypothetical protein [Hahellaceae bacterium]
MSTTILDMDDAELDALKARIVDAQEHDLALSKADMALLCDALETLAFLQERLTDKDITLHKMRKLLGRSNPLRSCGSDGLTQDGRVLAIPTGQTAFRCLPPQSPGANTGGDSSSTRWSEKGDDCPACGIGKVYKYEPARLLRITGNAPLTPELHLSERLRCNACGPFSRRRCLLTSWPMAKLTRNTATAPARSSP